MADQLQLRGGTTAQTATFTGALREVTVDTDKDTVVVHDNATVGGKPLLREDLSNLPAGTIDNADINASAAIAGTKISPDFGSQTIASTGVFSHPLGAAATPSLTFTGDVNTGIYSPGADQVAVATAGTGRLFVNSSGRVGVGGTPSTTFFHVYTDSPTTTSAPTICLEGGTNGYGAGVEFASRTSAGGTLVAMAKITADGEAPWNTTASTQDANLRFFTAADGSLSERLHITSAGLVGIGTSSPSEKFDVVGNINLPNVNSFIKGGGHNIVQVDATKTYLYGGTGGVQFRTADNLSALVDITNAGLVGIGNTGPDAKLHITGGASFTGGEANLAVTSSTTASVPATISSLNSDATLQIFAGGLGSGGSRGGQIDLKGGAAATDAGTILFRTGTGTGGTSQTEKARLDASGRLLVGTSTAIGSFQFAGSSRTSGCQIVGDTIDNGSFAVVRTTTGPVIYMGAGTSGLNVAANDALGYQSFHGYHTNAYYEGARITAHVDGTPGANDMPGRLVFSTTADGASTPTERMRITNGGDLFSLNADNGIVSRSTLPAGTANTIFTGQHSAASIISGTNCFKVYTNGNVENTNNSYGSLSDIKLKENVVDANSQWDDLKALQVRNYNLKEGQTHTQIGLVAQEVELVSPGLVSESPDRDEDGNDLGTVTKSVNYSVLYMKAVKALQEAMERIEILEASNTDLLARVSALESA